MTPFQIERILSLKWNDFVSYLNDFHIFMFWKLKILVKPRRFMSRFNEYRYLKAMGIGYTWMIRSW